MCFTGQFGANKADLGAGRPGPAHEDPVSPGGAAAEPFTRRGGPSAPGGLPVRSGLPGTPAEAASSDFFQPAGGSVTFFLKADSHVCNQVINPARKFFPLRVEMFILFCELMCTVYFFPLHK